MTKWLVADTTNVQGGKIEYTIPEQPLLHACCAEDHFADVNIDIRPEVKPDHVCDITKPLPFKKDEFAAVFFIILVAGVMIAAPTGFVQGHAQGADFQIMTCKEQHVLAERSNGKYACVYESTAEKLGWTVITVTAQTDDMSEPLDSGEVSSLQVSESDEQYWLSSDFAPLYVQNSTGSSAKKYVSLYAGSDPLANITKADIMPFWSRDDSFPYVQVKIPKSTPMTDTMTVAINYDFTPRHGAEFNPDNIVQDAAFGSFTDEKVPYMGAVFLVQHPPQIRMTSDYPTIPYDNDEYDCSGISWIILPYNGNVQHQAEISFVATAPISRMEDVFRISPEYSGVIDRSQWYISTDENAIVITPFPRNSTDFDVQSESGINMHFDKNYYTWTDRVYITITAPEHNLDSGAVDSIGGNSTGTGMITVSTGAAGINGYELTETGKDTDIFAGHVTLTGFQFEGMYHEHKHQISPRTGGTGPTGGLVATSAMPDQITVSFLSLGGENVTKSVPIRWNAGTVQWFDKYYEERYPAPEAPSFLIRLVDPDMNWNPDSADTFSVVVFSDTGVLATERHVTETGKSHIWRGPDQYVTETGKSTGIFEGPVFTTDTGGSPRLRITSTEDTLYSMYRDSTISQDMCNSVYLEHAVTINKRTPVVDFTYPLFSPPELPVDLYFR